MKESHQKKTSTVWLVFSFVIKALDKNDIILYNMIVNERGVKKFDLTRKNHK
jgi:hypothetical protein